MEENITVASTFNSDEPLVVTPNFIDDPILALSQNPVAEKEVKEEVQEMIDEQHSDFYNQHIEKDMDVLEKEYVSMERSAAIVDARIIRLKQQYKEVFDKLEALEKEKEKVLEHKEDYREVIARKLATIGEKKWKGMEIEFTYFPPSFKEVFNKKRFGAENPYLYSRYVDKQPVKEYIKQKLSLLPILPEDLKEENNGNESSK